MWGKDTLFEKMHQDFEAIESDPNKNVDEQEEDLAGKFGVFGYNVDDENIYTKHFDGRDEAISHAKELAKELGTILPEAGKELDTVEVWQADEEGKFGVSGESIWSQSEAYSKLAKESETNEEEVKEDELPEPGIEEPVESKEEKVEEAAPTMTTCPKCGETRLTKDFELPDGNIECPDCGWRPEAQESKTNEDEERVEEENTMKDTVSNDPTFEQTVDAFAQIESDPNKNVEEEFEEEGLPEPAEEEGLPEPSGAEADHDAAVNSLVDHIKEWVGEDVDEQSIRNVVWAFSVNSDLADEASHIAELYRKVREEMPESVEEPKTDEAKGKGSAQKVEKPKELKVKGDGDTGKLQKLEGKEKANEQDG